MGAGVINSDYRGEIGVVLFNHLAVDFPIQVGDRIAQLILEKIKTPAVQKVIVWVLLKGAMEDSGVWDCNLVVRQFQLCQKSGMEKVKKYKRENIRGLVKKRLLQAPIPRLGREKPSLVLEELVKPYSKLQARIMRRQ